MSREPISQCTCRARATDPNDPGPCVACLTQALSSRARTRPIEPAHLQALVEETRR